MNYRNNPGASNQQNEAHGGIRQVEDPHKTFGAKSSGFHFSGGVPNGTQVLLPDTAQDLLPITSDTSSGLVETPAATKAGGFSLANLGEIKGFVDRIGGIDGILTTVTKVQKVMSSVSQMAPLVKVIFGSFGKKSAADSDADDGGEWRPKRRKRRKTGTGGGSSNKGGGGGRNRRPRTPTTKRR